MQVNHKREANKKAKAEAQRAEQIRAAIRKRKDAGLSHAIINERRDKKFTKYTLEGVPQQFSSKHQFEASIRNPLGPEWNTSTSHNNLVKPKIKVKPGSIIKPISSFKM